MLALWAVFRVPENSPASPGPIFRLPIRLFIDPPLALDTNKSHPMPQPVMYFEIVSKDLKSQQTFYTELFDWTPTPMSGDYVEVSTGPNGIPGGISQPGDAPNSSITMYVQVDDIAQTLARVESLGGATIFPAMKIPDGNLIAMFTDPEGVPVGLFQRVEQGS